MPAFFYANKNLWPALAGLLFCLFIASPALAVNYAWNGGAAGDWDVPANWSPQPPAGSGVPGPGDTAGFESDATVTLGANRVVASLLIDAASVAFDGGGINSLTTSSMDLLRNCDLTMSNGGDHLIVTSSLDLQNNGLVLNGLGEFTVQGANSINCGAAGYIELDNDAKLNLNGNQTIGLITGIGSWGNGTEISLSNGATLTLTNPGAGWGNYMGDISGNGNLALAFSNSYSMTVTKTYTGWTRVISGELQLYGGGNNILPSTTFLQVDGGAQCSPARQTLAGISGAGTIEIHNDETLTVNQAVSSTFSGDIEDDGGDGEFHKTGTGRLTLTGTVRADEVEVQNGILVINGTVQRTTRINGGTLLGTGTVGFPSLTGGTLSPGNPIGTLSTTAGSAMYAGGTYLVEVSGGAADQLDVVGNVHIDGTTLRVAGVPAKGAQYTIINNNAADAVTGTLFSGLAEGDTFTSDVHAYQITYAGGTNSNDVVLTYLAPEIGVSGNGASIANGDATPSYADHTYFGNVDVSDGSKIRTFTIANTGVADLILTGALLVAIGGVHAGDFTVTAQPATPVAAAAATTFDVAFNPRAAGVRSATIRINSNDIDYPPYTFAIQGKGTTTPTPPTPAPDTPPAPSVPQGSGPSPAGSLDGSQLTWPFVRGATHYRIYRADCPLCPRREIGRTTENSFLDNTAIPRQPYTYWLRAENGDGLGVYSNWMAAWRYEQNPGRAGDFNGDGVCDLLWWDRDTGQLYIWFMLGGQVIGVSSPMEGLNISEWLLIATSDFNGDGACDLLWWKPETGEILFWYMQPSMATAESALFQATSDPISQTMTAHAALSYPGDLNGDGYSDILWRDYSSGEVFIWLMGSDGTLLLSGPPVPADESITKGERPGLTETLGWQVAGLADADGDGKDDVVWQDERNNRLVTWFMDGADILRAVEENKGLDTVWRLVGLGDLNMDGHADIVWRNEASGEVLAWLMQAGAFSEERAIIEGSDEAAKWQVKAVGDFCAPGCDDLYCKHSESSAARIVKLDGQEVTPTVE